MTFYRTIKRSSPFVQVDKDLVNDPEISAKAKGIMLYLLSKPDGWKIYESDVVKHMKDGKASINSGIKELIEAGYIEREQVRGEGGVFKGYSYTVYESKDDVEKAKAKADNINVSTETRFSDYGKTDYGKPDTSNNNLSNNNLSNIKPLVADKSDDTTAHEKSDHPVSDRPNANTNQSASDKPTAKKVIEYLNSITGKRYNYKAASNKRLVEARINEGYTMSDFKAVIDYKHKEWSSSEAMSKYVRPATLFSGKFDGYLNQAQFEETKRVGNTIEPPKNKGFGDLYDF